MQLLKAVKDGVKAAGHMLTAKEELMITFIEKELNNISANLSQAVANVDVVPQFKEAIVEVKKAAAEAFKESNPSAPIPKSITSAKPRLNIPDKKVDPLDEIMKKN